MTDALRLAIHLPREARHPLFIKVGSDRRQVRHVAKIHDAYELDQMKPFLIEAYGHSLSSTTSARAPTPTPRPPSGPPPRDRSQRTKTAPQRDVRALVPRAAVQAHSRS